MNVTSTIYENLFNEMNDGVYVLDENGRILQFNAAALSIFGYKEDEAVGMPIANLFSDPNLFESTSEKLRLGLPVKNVETEGVRQDQSTVYCSITVTLQKDAKGHQRFLGIIRDISWQVQNRQDMLERMRYESGISSASRALLSGGENALESAMHHLLLAANAGWIGILRSDVNNLGDYELINEAWALGTTQIKEFFSLPNHLLPQLEGGQYSIIHLSRLQRLERALFEARGIHSMLVLPIQVAGQHFGHIFFADMECEREWKTPNIEMLEAASSMIGTHLANQEAQEELRQNQYFLRQVIDLNPEFVFAKDRNGRYTLVNQAFATRYQLTPSDFVGKTDAELNIVDADKAKKFREADLSIMDSHEEISTVEDQVIFQDGEKRWLKTTKRPIHNVDGFATHLLAISTDLTDQKQSLQTIQEREYFLQAIINNLPGAVFWKDRNSVYQGANQFFASIAGTTPEDIIGRTDHDLPWEEAEADAFIKDDAEVMQAGSEKLGIVEPMLQADGSRAWLETNKIALKSEDDEVYGILGTFVDITEKIKLQEQVKRSLERRSRQVALSTRIAQEIAAAPDLTVLYQRVVDEIKEQLGFYHVQLLQYDPALDTVVLIAGYGEIGEKMLAMNHAMPMGLGLIGKAAASGQTVLRPLLQDDPAWQPNPLLSLTKGEIAIPIKSKDRVLGVLDVQSDTANSLTEDDKLLLEGLCGQIAIAIESTELRQELESQLRELMQLQRRLTQEGWEHFNKSNNNQLQHLGFQYDHSGVRPLNSTNVPPPKTEKSSHQANGYRNGANGHQQQPSPLANTEKTEPGLLQTPLSIRGQTIGQIGLKEQPDVPISEDEQQFLEAIAAEVAGALEAARLLQETENSLTEQARLAAELETVAKVSTAAATILDTEHLLQSVVDLTKESFSLYHAHIYLINDKGDFLELAAGAGVAGQLMLLEGHKISVFADSFVARAARTRVGVMENNVQRSIDFLPNPMLPETRAEIAVPMIVGDKIVGVLDVQANEVDVFSEEDLEIYKILASQIAVAHENAKQYSQQVETAKKLRDLDRLKGEFLASMSHELRTPLNSIIGFADVLLEGLDGDLNERMEEDVRLIKDSGTHLRELIGDILDMSKIEAGKMELRYGDVDMAQMAKDIMRTANSLANAKGLDLFLDIEDDVPVVSADKTRLRQVLWNIMGNAIKFTSKGSVTLRVAAKADHLLVSIRDTGIGIKEEHIPIVFEQFRQVDGRLERVAEGTGLGMPISKSLVELHGGDIWVESVLGQGSTFFFTVPYKRPEKVELDDDLLFD